MLDFPCHLQHIFGKSQVVRIAAETLQKGQRSNKPKEGWLSFSHKYIYVSTLEYWKGKKKSPANQKNTHIALLWRVITLNSVKPTCSS